MSGDVFGNGMLLPRQIRLLAAFDHRHVFIDPDPGPGASLRRAPAALRAAALAAGPTTTPTLLSAGGDVVPAPAKEVELTPEARARARPGRTTRTLLDGEALIRAMLRRRSTCSGTAASAPT